MDSILIFNPLEDRSILHKIGEKLLNEIRNLLAERGLELKVTAEALDSLLQQGYNSEYGARYLKRTLDRLIREPLALRLHTGEFKSGDAILVSLKPDSQNDLIFEKA